MGGISNSNDIFKQNLQQMTFARKNNVIALVCMRLYIYPIFENQPNDICGHLSEEASKGRFLKPDKF